MTVPKPVANISVRDLLLYGHPGELLPRDLPWAKEQARALIADPERSESAKQRVREVWLDGLDRPRWDPKGDA